MSLRSYARVDALDMQFGQLAQSPVHAKREALHITYNGSTYEYRNYRYESFADALSHARHDLLSS